MSDFMMVITAGTLALMILVAFVGLIGIVRSLLTRGGSAANQQTDLTNMMILFQTMRDILAQQKDLARQFNQSVDRKVSEVRELMESTGALRDEYAKVEDAVTELARETRGEIDAMRRRLVYLREGMPELAEDLDEALMDHEPGQILNEVSAPKDAIQAESDLAETEHVAMEEAVTEEEPVADVPDAEPARTSNGGGVNGEEPRSRPKSPSQILEEWAGPAPRDQREESTSHVAPLRIIARQRPNEPSDLIDSWTGLDFGASVTAVEDDEDDLVEDEVLEPDNPAETRDAFRSLLNFETDESVVEEDELDAEAYLTPVQKRIYEYADAGMRVPEIARELGVGKGEVRLILSLRQDRAR